MGLFITFAAGGFPDQTQFFQPNPPNPAINFSNSTYLM